LSIKINFRKSCCETGGASVGVPKRNCCDMSEANALYRLSNSFPYLLNRVGVRMGELFSRRIAPFGVTLPMYRVMAALWEKGDQRLSDLAEVTTSEISTLSRLIGEMKRKGLVTRSRPEDNGRTVAINLTAKGRGLVEELMPIAVHFAEVAVSSYTEDEVDRLKAIFREIYERLGSIEPEIEAARVSMKSKRKLSPPRAPAQSRAKG
jgi:MarR family transcriptional regulator, organic hydroperoxide resistance regulator